MLWFVSSNFFYVYICFVKFFNDRVSFKCVYFLLFCIYFIKVLIDLLVRKISGKFNCYCGVFLEVVVKRNGFVMMFNN